MPRIARTMYLSSAVGNPQNFDMDRLLDQCRRNNAKRGITGILLWADGCFLQVLEGPPEAVENLLDVIGQDARHHDMCLLEEKIVNARIFPQWSMEARHIIGTVSSPFMQHGETFRETMQRIAEAENEIILPIFLHNFFDHADTLKKSATP